MNDKVSIVVPIYNRERFLDKCIKSLLSQTYTNIEIILVNDGSKDNSLDICRKYEKDDKRIKVIDKENGGVQSARNRGIDGATGKYICFVDADDYVTSSYVQNFINVYEKEDVECVVGGHIRIDENDKVLASNNDLINMDIPKFQSERWALYFERFACYCWNHMFLLDIVKSNNVRFDKDIVIFDDTAFSMNYMNNIHNIGFTNSNDYYYLCEHSDLTVAKRLGRKRVNDGGCREKIFTCIKKYNEYVKNKNLYAKDCGDLMWVSSSLYHILFISYLIYSSSLLYDYRYNKKYIYEKFNSMYKYIKTENVENWFYEPNLLHTSFQSVKLVKVMVKKFFGNKYLFYFFCYLFGNRLLCDIRLGLQKKRMQSNL